jgi:hypothetical protein
MISKFRILLLVPFLMAMQCDEDEVSCGPEFVNDYEVNVENLNETYAVAETIWFNGEVSSELPDRCDPNSTEVVLDSNIFVTGFFVLKLTNELNNVNAEIVEDYDVTFSVGEAFSSDFCVEFVHFSPELSEDNLTHNYRVGISINEPGDYCVVPAFRNNFDGLQEGNNALIFDSYNNLDNAIKFVSCNDTYTRTGMDGQYFFNVN